MPETVHCVYTIDGEGKDVRDTHVHNKALCVWDRFHS